MAVATEPSSTTTPTKQTRFGAPRRTSSTPKKDNNGREVLDNEDEDVEEIEVDDDEVAAEEMENENGGKRRRSGHEPSRVLTMKYGKGQMAAIRRRVRVEDWLDQQLEGLFNGKNPSIELDVEELRKMTDVAMRRRQVFDALQRRFCPASMARISSFLDAVDAKMAEWNAELIAASEKK